MKYTEELLTEWVKSSQSVADMMRQNGLKLSGSTHKLLSQKIKKFGIDTSHFATGYGNVGNHKKPWQEVLVNRIGDTIRRSAFKLRRALLESGRPYVCATAGCGLGPLWLGRTLVLQVNHKDGNWINDSPDNLEFLCPNCHTQTPGYGGSKGHTGLTRRNLDK